MPFVTVNGKKAHYVCPSSLPGDTRGRVVVLVHGARGNHKIWEPQLEALARNYTPIGIDLPGHGQSEGPGSDEVSHYREFVKGLVDATGLESFVMAGHSMGGSIALDYALHYPGVEALILVGSAARWDIGKEYLDLWRTDPERVKQEGRRRSFAKATPDWIVDMNERNNASTSNEVALGDLEACSRFNVLSKLGKIDCPACIICGVEDSYLNGSKLLHKKIADSRLEWVEDAGHDATIEQPEVTNSIFLDFLGSLP